MIPNMKAYQVFHVFQLAPHSHTIPCSLLIPYLFGILHIHIEHQMFVYGIEITYKIWYFSLPFSRRLNTCKYSYAQISECDQLIQLRDENGFSRYFLLKKQIWPVLFMLLLIYENLNISVNDH